MLKNNTFPFLYHYNRNFQNFDQKLWGPLFFFLVHQYNFNSIYLTCVMTALYIVERFIMQVKKGVKQRSKISLGLLCRGLCITRNFSDPQNLLFIIKSGFYSRAWCKYGHETSLKMYSSSFYNFHTKITLVDVNS